MTEPVNLPALFELAKKATPGPWATEPAREWHPIPSILKERIYAIDPGPENDFTIGFVQDADESTRNTHAKLLTASVNALPAIKKMVEGAKQLAVKWDEGTDSYSDGWQERDAAREQCARELRAILAEVGVKAP